jgi:hypothetical protein
MQSRQVVALSIAFVIGLAAVGVPYWQIPYAKLALPNSIINAWLFAPFGAAAVVRLLAEVSFLRSSLTVGLAVPGAVLLRVIVGVLGDPTSHNLWPLEVFLASAVGFAVSFCGALLGSGLLLLLGRGSAA